MTRRRSKLSDILCAALCLAASYSALACGEADEITAQQWANTAAAAARHDLEPELLAALVWQESRYCAEAVSSAGAIGLGQLMPATALELGVDPWQPEENLEGAARYLRAQLDAFGTVELALAAYNAGPEAVKRYGGLPPYAETQAYVPAVMTFYEDFKRQRGVETGVTSEPASSEVTEPLPLLVYREEDAAQPVGDSLLIYSRDVAQGKPPKSDLQPSNSSFIVSEQTEQKPSQEVETEGGD